MKEVHSQFITPRGFRNLNPFNIRYSKRNNWIGQVGHDEQGFCRFDSLEHGIDAGIKLLKNYVRRKVNTPAKIIRRFAPSNENSTDLYIKYVCDSSHLSPDQEITDYRTLVRLVYAILRYENGTKYVEGRIETLCGLIECPNYPLK